MCLPGGPTDSAYVADLGGLTAHRRVIRLDLRGTGRSATPRDTASCRCDRLVDDVEALREHLGPDRTDLLAHCAGAHPAVLPASRRPDGVGRLVPASPGVRAVGLTITGDRRLRTARLRREEPWFPEAFAALEAIVAGEAAPDRWKAVAPFSHGRWDTAAGTRPLGRDGRGPSGHRGRADEPGDRRRLRPDGHPRRAAPARFARPVLLLAGEPDPGAPPGTTAEFAGLFPGAGFVVQPGAGHHPWRDDADRFVAAVAAFPGPAASSSQSRPSPDGGRDHGTPSSKSA
ncbi:alpha/beta fold hydrolase [Streptomyces olivaceoviridis]